MGVTERVVAAWKGRVVVAVVTYLLALVLYLAADYVVPRTTVVAFFYVPVVLAGWALDTLGGLSVLYKLVPSVGSVVLGLYFLTTDGWSGGVAVLAFVGIVGVIDSVGRP